MEYFRQHICFLGLHADRNCYTRDYELLQLSQRCRVVWERLLHRHVSLSCMLV
jgi:hypothetical protein